MTPVDVPVGKKFAFLAEPAKRQRVLTKCDFWFGRDNLPADRFVMEVMAAHDGWMPLHTLLGFPTLCWVSVETLMGALSGPGAARYETQHIGGIDVFRPVKFGQHFAAARRTLERLQADVTPEMLMETAAMTYGGGEARQADRERGREKREERAEMNAWHKNLPAFRYGGRVEVATTYRRANELCAMLLGTLPRGSDTPRAVGFDVEYARSLSMARLVRIAMLRWRVRSSVPQLSCREHAAVCALYALA